MIVAITGKIGAGKTTTAEIFAEHGFRVIDVDSIGHELLDIKEVQEKLKAEFGMKILDKSLKIDRAKLREEVFCSDDKLKKLNSAVHPFLKAKVKEMLSDKPDNIAVDAALYHELEIERHADVTILLTCDIDKVYVRLKSYTKEQILNIIRNQQTVKKPDYVLDNNGSIDELKAKVEKVIHEIQP